MDAVPGAPTASAKSSRKWPGDTGFENDRRSLRSHGPVGQWALNQVYTAPLAGA